MKRVLFTATLVRGHIAKFHIPYLRWFKEQGWETWVAARNDYPDGVCEIPYCDHYINVPFSRSPYNFFEHVHVLGQLKKLLSETHFDLIHTHTPVGSVITRLAAKGIRKNGTKVIYTAHGFHFYKGAPLSGWLVWYPIERFMTRYLDRLVTINKEDYKRAQDFAHCDVSWVHGVGVASLPRIEKISKEDTRNKLGVKPGEHMVLAVGDVNKNKNQIVLIEAIEQLPKEYRLFIAGDGELMDCYEKLIAERGVAQRVTLLGFRRDVMDIMESCDVFCLPSLREGLSVSLLEAMLVGVPCLSSNVRGCSDVLTLIPGSLVEGDAAVWAQEIKRVTALNISQRERIISMQNDVLKDYMLENTLYEHACIYQSVLESS